MLCGEGAARVQSDGIAVPGVLVHLEVGIV